MVFFSLPTSSKQGFVKCGCNWSSGVGWHHFRIIVHVFLTSKKSNTRLGQSNTKMMSQTVVSQFAGTVPLPRLKFRTWGTKYYEYGNILSWIDDEIIVTFRKETVLWQRCSVSYIGVPFLFISIRWILKGKGDKFLWIILK